MLHKHRARTFYWENGVLSTRDYFFENAQDAINFSHSKIVRFQHVIKVYDELEQLIHEVNHTSSDSSRYA